MYKKKKKENKTRNKEVVKHTVLCSKNCYFGGDFYRGGETYTMTEALAEMAANTNNFNKA